MRRVPETHYGKAPDGTHIGFQVVGHGPVDLLFIGPALSHLDLHLASRVLGRAESGQVLVSRTIVDLVAGTVIKFEDCGHHVLKGVEGSWRLFAVVDA